VINHIWQIENFVLCRKVFSFGDAVLNRRLAAITNLFCHARAPDVNIDFDLAYAKSKRDGAKELNLFFPASERQVVCNSLGKARQLAVPRRAQKQTYTTSLATSLADFFG
jgi:hypothetical protein